VVVVAVVVAAPDQGMPYNGPKHSVLRLLALSTKLRIQSWKSSCDKRDH